MPSVNDDNYERVVARILEAVPDDTNRATLELFFAATEPPKPVTNPPPSMEQLKSEQMSIRSPMSFTGARERMVRLIGRVDNDAVRFAVAWPLGIIGLVAWWGLILVWYVTFGLLLVPWRLIRRGSRKRKLDDQRHREIMETQRKD